MGCVPVARSRAAKGSERPSPSSTDRESTWTFTAGVSDEKVDVKVAVVIGWSQRDPLLGRRTGQVVFGEVGAIVWL